MREVFMAAKVRFSGGGTESECGELMGYSPQICGECNLHSFTEYTQQMI